MWTTKRFLNYAHRRFESEIGERFMAWSTQDLVVIWPYGSTL